MGILLLLLFFPGPILSFRMHPSFFPFAAFAARNITQRSQRDRGEATAREEQKGKKEGKKVSIYGPGMRRSNERSLAALPNVIYIISQ